MSHNKDRSQNSPAPKIDKKVCICWYINNHLYAHPVGFFSKGIFVCVSIIPCAFLISPAPRSPPGTGLFWARSLLWDISSFYHRNRAFTSIEHSPSSAPRIRLIGVTKPEFSRFRAFQSKNV